MSELATFGQELYFEESMKAIETLSGAQDGERLSAAIAELLPHPSNATRLRVASKISQRFFRPPDAFLAMVRTARDEASKRDLLYWRTARTDGIIASLAAQVFYPYFVLCELPQGYDDSTFRLANTSTLFSVDRIISRDFAITYAREMWGFDSVRTVILALRIMRQAGLLESVLLEVMGRHVLGYYPKPHPMSVEVFAYCLYEEFFDESPTVALDRIYNADCVKCFLLLPYQVDSILKELQERGLVTTVAYPGGRHIRLNAEDMEQLVILLSGNVER